MIELKITGEKETESYCHMKGNAHDLAAEASVAFEKILEALPEPLRKYVLLMVTVHVIDEMEK